MNRSADKRIQEIFSEIPKTYDLINHILTFRLDILWRKRAAKIASTYRGQRWLDVCSGTGDMAGALRKAALPQTKIVALDFCLPMLKEIEKKPQGRRVSLCVSNVNALPFADNTFDVVTIAFATRNLNSSRDILLQRFQEFRRVLKPEGTFINLETTQPVSKCLRNLFHLYAGFAIKPIGYLISGSKAAYGYLSYTIPRFFNAEELADVMYRAGFKKVDFIFLSFGIAAVHTAIK